MGQRIVIASWGSFGDVNPYVGLALGLRARGHRPLLVMPAWYRSYVEQEGLEFHPMRPDVDPTRTDVVRRIMEPRRGTEVILRDILLPSLRESYEDLRDALRGADLLVSHPITFAGPILAEQLDLPWVSTVLAPMSFFSVHDLPVFSPAPRMVHLRRLGRGVSSALVSTVKSVTRRWTRPIDRFRAELGLPPRRDPIFQGQYSPHLVLALFSRVLADPQPDWPANVRITGQIFYDGPGGSRRLDPELERFLDAGAPPVVFTLGSSAVMAAGGFYHESLEAVVRLGLRAVLLVGRDPANLPPGPLPESVVAVEFAPHSEVFPRAAAVVHQGGAGTLGQALRSGRPELVVPHAHDQPDNAFRVTNLGVARTLFPRRYSAARVADELRTLLEEPSYARRAGEVGRVVRAEDGVGAACDAIEEILGPPGS